MDENKSGLISPEMAKLMVKQILNKHNITKENMTEVSDEEKARIKEMAQDFKAQVDALLNNNKQSSKKKKEVTKSSNDESEVPKRMSLRDKIRQRRGK